jgi:hypothetical protein
MNVQPWQPQAWARPRALSQGLMQVCLTYGTAYVAIQAPDARVMGCTGRLMSHDARCMHQRVFDGREGCGIDGNGLLELSVPLPFCLFS